MDCPILYVLPRFPLYNFIDRIIDKYESQICNNYLNTNKIFYYLILYNVYCEYYEIGYRSVIVVFYLKKNDITLV